MGKKFRNNYNIPNIDKIKSPEDEEPINRKKKHPNLLDEIELAEELNPDDFE